MSQPDKRGMITRTDKPYRERISYWPSTPRQPGRCKGRIHLAEDFDQTPEDLIDGFEGQGLKANDLRGYATNAEQKA